MSSKGPTTATCNACGAAFAVEYAYQVVSSPSGTSYVCTPECRKSLGARTSKSAVADQDDAPRVIAVMNQKGGTGKTTSAVNIAAGLADAGYRTLLVDADPQGHVGVSLGARGENGVYDVLVGGVDPQKAAVPVREGLDIISSTERLAAAEVSLARRGVDRQKVFTTRMRGLRGYEYVIVDCGPSLSLVNLNMLVYAEELIVPVACDFLSLLGVRHLLSTVERLNGTFEDPIEVFGFLPTFFDRRNRISEESVERLKSRFGKLVLKPIRINASLKEAPSHGMSIFEYAPYSRGAQDYRRLCQQIVTTGH